jgi:hypothetical protein
MRFQDDTARSAAACSPAGRGAILWVAQDMAYLGPQATPMKFHACRSVGEASATAYIRCQEADKSNATMPAPPAKFSFCPSPLSTR